MPLDPSQLVVSQITPDEIREFNHTLESMRVDRFSVGETDSEMTFQIPGDKLKPAMQRILGVDFMDAANHLRRVTPMFHPVYPWNYAKHVTVQGQCSDGDDTEAVIWEGQVTPSKWVQYKVVVRFDLPAFEVWEDDDVDTELERYVGKVPTPNTKLVYIENGQVLYDGNPGDPWNNEPMAATVPLARQEGAGYSVKWWRVPEEFICEDADSAPLKMMLAVGKVNSVEMFRCPVETLMLRSVLIEKYPCPLVTDANRGLYYLCDVTFDFDHVNQLSAKMGKAGETRRGWNVVVGPKQKWWYVRVAGDLTPPFTPVDLRKLWTHWSDPLT